MDNVDDSTNSLSILRILGNIVVVAAVVVVDAAAAAAAVEAAAVVVAVAVDSSPHLPIPKKNYA